MKITQETIEDWRSRASDWLAARGFHCEQVLTGVDAWTVAHNTGMTADAYKDRAVVDAHIQTALQRIFPNAAFKDKKAY